MVTGKAAPKLLPSIFRFPTAFWRYEGATLHPSKRAEPSKCFAWFDPLF